MPNRRLALAATAVAALIALPAHAQTEIQWWHSMGGALGEWVNDLAKEFNASQLGRIHDRRRCRLPRRQRARHPAGV